MKVSTFLVLEYGTHMNIIGMCPSIFSEYILTDHFFLFLDLPANEKLHDLASLLIFDSSKVSDEMLGEESVWHHQRILQEHWGSGDTAVLPGDDVQHLLLGVSITEGVPLRCCLRGLIEMSFLLPNFTHGIVMNWWFWYHHFSFRLIRCWS